MTLALGERIRDTVQPQLQALHLRASPGRTQGIGYYRTAAFKIILCSDRTESELADRGFTASTATSHSRRQGAMPDLLRLIRMPGPTRRKDDLQA